MKHNIIPILLGITAILLGSCDTEIEYRGEQTEPMMYIVANINPEADSSMIFVGRTSFFLDEQETRCFDDARVIITHQGRQYQLQYHAPDASVGGPYMKDDEYYFDTTDYSQWYDDNGYYNKARLSPGGHYPDIDFRPPTPIGYYLWQPGQPIAAGDTITLTAETEGLTPVKSQVVVPHPIEISLADSTITLDGRLRLRLRLDYPTPHTDVAGLAFDIDHKLILEKYYFDPDNDYQIDPDTLIIDTTDSYSYFLSDDIFFRDIDNILSASDDNLFQYTFYQSTDKFTSSPCQIYIDLPYSYSVGGYDIHSVSYLSTTVYVTTLSYGKYRHVVTRQQSADAAYNPFAEPVQIYSNIENGAGYMGISIGRELKIRGDTTKERRL